MMDDILGLSAKPQGDHTKRIKDLVRDHWDVAEDTVIMVSELRCHEEGCPDAETVIALMDGAPEPRKVKISKSMADVDAMAIQSAVPA